MNSGGVSVRAPNYEMLQASKAWCASGAEARLFRDQAGDRIATVEQTLPSALSLTGPQAARVR